MKDLVKVIFGRLILLNINTQYSLCKLVLSDTDIVEIKNKNNATKNSEIKNCIIENIENSKDELNKLSNLIQSK